MSIRRAACNFILCLARRDGACLVSSTRHPPAAIGSQTCVSLPPHEITEPANPNLQRNTHSDTPDSPVHTLREPADSGQGESFAPIAREPVESGLQENGDSQRTLNDDLPCEVETAKPTPLQGTQSTEPRSQESDTGFAESPRGESRTVATLTCEDMRAGSISQGIITASAAPQGEEPTNRDPRDMQPTDLTPWEPEISDLASREIETASCDSPQETESVSLAPCETETETGDPAGCQEPEAASLASHEIAPQDPESADRIRPQEPEIANSAPGETIDTDYCDVTNVNPLMIADPPLPKFSTANVEPSEAETDDIDSLKTADLDALGTKTTDPAPQEPQITNVDPYKTNDVISPEIVNPLQEPQAAHSVPQDNRRSISEEAGHYSIGASNER